MKEKEIIQYSENAEIRYYDGNAIKVDNFDCDVEFAETEKFQANVERDKDGNIVVHPFGKEGSRGPRSITLFDTGVVKFKKSPKGTNLKMEVVLPRNCASERNIRHHVSVAFDLLREAGVNIKED